MKEVGERVLTIAVNGRRTVGWGNGNGGAGITSLKYTPPFKAMSLSFIGYSTSASKSFASDYKLSDNSKPSLYLL